MGGSFRSLLLRCPFFRKWYEQSCRVATEKKKGSEREQVKQRPRSKEHQFREQGAVVPKPACRCEELRRPKVSTPGLYACVGSEEQGET